LEKKKTQLGKNSCGGTPGPIPNPEVKPVNAESTWREASREDRNLPSFFLFFEKNYTKNCAFYQEIKYVCTFKIIAWVKVN
jgi:hypothetical protein